MDPENKAFPELIEKALPSSQVRSVSSQTVPLATSQAKKDQEKDAADKAKLKADAQDVRDLPLERLHSDYQGGGKDFVCSSFEDEENLGDASDLQLRRRQVNLGSPRESRGLSDFVSHTEGDSGVDGGTP